MKNWQLMKEYKYRDERYVLYKKHSTTCFIKQVVETLSIYIVAIISFIAIL